MTCDIYKALHGHAGCNSDFGNIPNRLAKKNESPCSDECAPTKEPSSMNPITPTVGRIVLVRYNDPLHADGYTDPVPAIITKVHSPDSVNLHVFKDNGDSFPAVFVQYQFSVAHGHHGGMVWSWMDYQIRKAAEETYGDACTADSPSR